MEVKVSTKILGLTLWSFWIVRLDSNGCQSLFGCKYFCRFFRFQSWRRCILHLRAFGFAYRLLCSWNRALFLSNVRQFFCGKHLHHSYFYLLHSKFSSLVLVAACKSRSVNKTQVFHSQKWAFLKFRHSTAVPLTSGCFFVLRWLFPKTYRSRLVELGHFCLSV